jgi:hypothetical protein
MEEVQQCVLCAKHNIKECVPEMISGGAEKIIFVKTIL